MKNFVGIVFGLFSALLIYLMGMMIIIGPNASISERPAIRGALIFILFGGGWIASSWLLLRGAPSTTRIITRSFLLGAAEWLAMIFVSAIFIARGARSSGSLATAVSGAFSFIMALICLACYAVTRLLAREMKPERS